MTAARSLTVARVADREAMAAKVAELATRYGAAAEIERQPYGDMSPRSIMVRIRTPRGLCLNVDLDGDDAQARRGEWVLSWYIATDSDARLADSFGGNVNPHHHSKATYLADGLEGQFGLLSQISIGLTKAREGSAFDAAREAAFVAKDGTAAERQAKWDEYLREFAAQRTARAAE